jgi:hypothetical protein
MIMSTAFLAFAGSGATMAVTVGAVDCLAEQSLGAEAGSVSDNNSVEHLMVHSFVAASTYSATNVVAITDAIVALLGGYLFVSLASSFKFAIPARVAPLSGLYIHTVARLVKQSKEICTNAASSP